jgi:hypothetical protein
MSRLRLCVGGLAFEVAAQSVQTQQDASRRYGHWASDRPCHGATWVVDIDGSLPAPRGTADADVLLERRGPELSMRREDFVVAVRPDDNRASIRFAFPASLHSALRVLTSTALLCSGGLLLHASSVVDRERALLFAGRSGSGKTTLARLGAPGTALGDECCAVLPSGGGWICAPTPFWGEMAPATQPTVPSPLAAVYLIAHGARHRLERLEQGRRVQAILGCAFVFGADSILCTRALDASVALCASVPTRRLEFAPDPSVWQFLRLDA